MTAASGGLLLVSGVARSLRLRCRSTADGCHDLVAPVGGVWACPSSVDGGVVSRPFAGSYRRLGWAVLGYGMGSFLWEGQCWERVVCPPHDKMRWFDSRQWRASVGVEGYPSPFGCGVDLRPMVVTIWSHLWVVSGPARRLLMAEWCPGCLQGLTEGWDGQC